MAARGRGGVVNQTEPYSLGPILISILPGDFYDFKIWRKKYRHQLK